jgi:hypothetical protein
MTPSPGHHIPAFISGKAGCGLSTPDSIEPA